jgi:hypothetical protein
MASPMGRLGVITGLTTECSRETEAEEKENEKEQDED